MKPRMWPGDKKVRWKPVQWIKPIESRYFETSYHLVVIFVTALMLLASLSSCGIGVRTRSLFGGKLEVAVTVSQDANQNSPVAMDLLVVYDEELLKELLKLSGRTWFDKRDQYRRDYAGQDGFDSWGWEWVPGQTVPVQELPLEASAVGGIIYVSYRSPGEHRARIDPHTSIRVRLGEKDFTVSPM